MATVSAMTRLSRRATSVLLASDPGLSRLRLAATTIATIAVTLTALAGLVTVAGQPITVAMPGVVLSMIASLAVRESEPGRLVVSILALAPAALVGVGLGSLFTGAPVSAEVVFVVLAVVAVFVQRTGPRGVAIGMVAFIAYFLALFVQIKPAQLPAVAVAVACGAVVCAAMRILLRPRHPDRELRRMVTALGVRAGRAVELFGTAVREGRFSDRLARRTQARVTSSGETAAAVDQHLTDAGDDLVNTIGNDELAVRVFDFQLAVESLGSAVRVTLEDDVGIDSHAARSLDELRAFLVSPGRSTVALSPPGDDTSALHRALTATVEAWRRVTEPRRDPETADVDQADDGVDESGDTPTWSVTAKQAMQVGLASGLAIIAGNQLSSTRWFWAVITAFVVYVGTSTRGETLSRGWQRVLGTMAGVVVGVVVASIVGSNTAAAVALIFLCLFLGVYLLAVSSAFMMFFITTMLALLYGLLGMFSVNLLLVRLEETAAGAVIGVLVSYVVFPISTRETARDKVHAFLDELGETIMCSAADLRGSSDQGRAPAGQRARALRDSFQTVRTTAKPLTTGLAGLPDRADTRRTMLVLAVCQYHGGRLSRVADGATGSAPEQDADLLDRAARSVQINLDALAEVIIDRSAKIVVQPTSSLLDELEEDANSTIRAAVQHLRAIDHAACSRAGELGATEQPTQDTAPTG